MLVDIAIKSPLRRLFTYEVDGVLKRGQRVRIPFRSQEKIGFVWAMTEKAPPGLRKISGVCEEEPLFDEKTLDFYERASMYYGIPIGELLHNSLPKKIREGKGLEEFRPKHFVPVLPKLSEAQQKIFEQMKANHDFRVHLLKGDTGSGKTEIYLHWMEKVLMEGGQVLFLVPEISLTPQLEQRLAERLGSPVNCFHSQLKESDRMETFCRARSSEAGVFLGARSALFLPYRNLRLIVVDEEHDSSYKQAERGTYQARDLAILRAKLYQIPIVLGSATPSLESYARAQEDSQTLYSLPPYYTATTAPEWTFVDLKEAWKTEARSFLSDKLYEALADNLSRGEQSLLFLNRRGTASSRVCVGCGHQETCKNCSVTLTIHEDLHCGLCHWCGYRKKIEASCPECSGKEFFLGGIGTKELEAQVKLRFPEARVVRLDRDQTTKRASLPNTLKDFSEGKIDILIGTQMISKGIDIANLSLVGIVLADQGWSVPDFRSMERSFQLLKQVVGRAGRRGQTSRIVVQSFMPDHPVFEWLQSENSFEKFAAHELEIRKLAGLPPYKKMCLLTLSHKNESRVKTDSEALARACQNLARSLELELVGPVPAPISRWKNAYRFQILVKGDPRAKFTAFVQSVLDHVERFPLQSQLKLDRDPYHFL